MTVWLSPDDVADRLKVARKTAIALMHKMPYSVIGGTVRQRIRVSEKDLELWMVKQSAGGTKVSTIAGNCTRRLERR